MNARKLTCILKKSQPSNFEEQIDDLNLFEFLEQIIFSTF